MLNEYDVEDSNTLIRILKSLYSRLSEIENEVDRLKNAINDNATIKYISNDLK